MPPPPPPPPCPPPLPPPPLSPTPIVSASSSSTSFSSHADLWRTDFSRSSELSSKISSSLRLLHPPSSSSPPVSTKPSGKDIAILRGRLAELQELLSHLQLTMSVSVSPSVPLSTSVISERSKLLNELYTKYHMYEKEYNSFCQATAIRSGGGGGHAVTSSTSAGGFDRSVIGRTQQGSVYGGSDSRVISKNPFQSDYESSGVMQSIDGRSGSGVGMRQHNNVLGVVDHDVYGSRDQSDSIVSQSEERSLLASQETQLDYLEGTVHNLKSIGNGINEEVTLHQRLLGDLDGEIDESQGRLRREGGRLNSLMRAGGRGVGWLMCLVILLVVVLVFVIIYVT
eukprot:GHVQ01040762.1.p1 GENE.GHVQ01040762.1~~GHVQ01040762.1.p1  ORF type:complete len:340 (+),score=71.21 GHVQ01040762.1:516-1535(+)